MALVKCPRCELNYMDESQKCCDVCRRGMRDEPDPAEYGICPACGERPVMRGRELCIVCQKEHLRLQKIENLALAAEDGETIDLIEVNELDEMQEMDVSIDVEIPRSEYEVIHRELTDGEEDEEGEPDADDGEEEEEDLILPLDDDEPDPEDE